MQYTENYNLNKLELLDAPPNIEVLNPNWDTIDRILKEFSDGKQEHTAYVTNANLNTLLEDKAYICSGTLTNAPVATTYCFLRVYDTESTNRVLQVCYVPNSDNTVRTFTRAITGTATFGAWLELGTTKYIDEQMAVANVLIAENAFRNKALAGAVSKNLTTLFIHTFTDVSAINQTKGNGAAAVANYYNAATHLFDKNATGTVTIYTIANVVTTGNDKAWAIADWENVDGGSVELAVSRDGGTTYTTLANDTLTDISTQSAGISMILRITLTGKLKLNNVGWGCK